MSYVDGYLVPVKNEQKQAYKDLAEFMIPVFKDHGALRVVENWGDDVPDGEVTSMPMAVKLEPDETVVFSWVIWPSKEVRESGMASMMEDQRMKDCADSFPFDGKRMIFGSFTTMVDG